MPIPITPKLTVDAVIFHNEAVVLVRRKNPPFKGQYALPGGFVEIGETVEEACVREVKEETNLDLKNLKMIGVYSHPKRVPNAHVVTVAFCGQANIAPLKAGDDAAEAELVSNWKNFDLGFDHKQIIEDSLKIKSDK